jgi:hypothetical protein
MGFTPQAYPPPVTRKGARAGSRARRAAISLEKRRDGVLRGMSDIRRFFHRNETPIYYFAATNFNLLGIDEWVRNFRHVNHVDCFDGRHPNTFVPDEMEHPQFESIEDIVQYLLRHPQVSEYVTRRARDRDGAGKAAFLMFDEECEAAARELGLEVWFPPASLRNRVDNKIETVRIGEAAGVPSVPNVLAEVNSWSELREASRHLGERLVVQTAFGDSGHTTFFIDDEDDWNRHADEIVGQGEVKIMKRIRCRGSAIEACATSAGTIVGPLMTELVGFPELTPYGGGWCGNEIFPGSFTPEIRKKAVEYTSAFGEQLRAEGYRGYFELDLLIAEEDGSLWLGELNPRITGASSITNHAAFAHADAPLFLFPLLEFSGVPFELDVEELNSRWADEDNIDEWSQLVIKHVPDEVDVVTQAPESGIWRMGDDGRLSYARFDYHRRAVETER